MDQVLYGVHFHYAYVDDILLAISSPKEHQHHLQVVLEHLNKHGALINPVKCMLGVDQLEFLGHNVN